MRILSLAFLALLSSQAMAAWTLDNQQSSLNFVTTKNEHISEVQQFMKLSGSLTDDGQLTVKVDLGSVNTGIEIRDQRMREKLFHIEQYPLATVSAKLHESLLGLKTGNSITTPVSFKLTLNGVEQPVETMVRISKLANQTLAATTVKPILIHAANYNLAAGVGTLKEIAGLGSISMVVPVTFNVTFVPK